MFLIVFKSFQNFSSDLFLLWIVNVNLLFSWRIKNVSNYCHNLVHLFDRCLVWYIFFSLLRFRSHADRSALYVCSLVFIQLSSVNATWHECWRNLALAVRGCDRYFRELQRAVLHSGYNPPRRSKVYRLTPEVHLLGECRRDPVSGTYDRYSEGVPETGLCWYRWHGKGGYDVERSETPQWPKQRILLTMSSSAPKLRSRYSMFDF